MNKDTENIKNLQQRLAYLLKAEQDAKDETAQIDKEVDQMLRQHAPELVEKRDAAKKRLSDQRKACKKLRNKTYELLGWAGDFVEGEVEGFSTYNSFTVEVRSEFALFMAALQHFPHWLKVDMKAVKSSVKAAVGNPDENGVYELPEPMRWLLMGDDDPLINVYDRKAWKISDSTLRVLAPDNEPDPDAPGLEKSDYIPF